MLKKSFLLWENTYKNAKEESAPKSILVQTQALIKELKHLSDSVKKKYDRALTDTQTIGTKVLLLNEMVELIKARQLDVSNQVFQQNKAPLFSLSFENGIAMLGFFKSIQNSIFEKSILIKDYFITNREIWPYFATISTLSLFFVVFYHVLYRKKRLFVKKSTEGKKVFLFIDRPLATYTILFILSFVFVFPNRPQALIEIALVVLFIPVIRILQTVVQKTFHKYIYLIFIIFIAEWLVQNGIGFELEKRFSLLFINIAFLLYTVILVFKKIPYLAGRNSSFFKLINSILVFFILFLVLALGANIYGAELLSMRILGGTLKVFYSAMIFYAVYIILTGYIIVILRRRIASASYMLERYSRDIEKTTRLLIKIWMMGWWLLVVTKTISLYPILAVFIEDFLATSFTIAKSTISIQSIVDFIFIFIGTWALAHFMRTILEMEIFARFKLPRGVPTAIITTLNYIIIVTGTIIAFSSLGVSAQQFAIIFGALGVGIGFGLRNIIANFVSGIIMVFERPVQIGDTIEVDKTMGSVQSIGARSSTIKTFDGSEVIIPNADFIAKEIVNWTLSDEHRRKVIEFKVDLESDMEMILTMIHDIAATHKDVLKEPAPLATVKSFGEYYIEFKLYFWLSDNLIVAQSEINIAIIRALKEAGVRVPTPKTEMINYNLNAT